MSLDDNGAEPVGTIMRDAAERAVSQARDAYSRCASFGEEVHNTFEDWMREAWSGAREVSYRALTFADENARRGFDHAESLVRAKDLNEFLALQQDRLGEQARRVAQQVRELGEMSARITREMARPATNGSPAGPSSGDR